jgi:hypothetical protein
MHYRLTKQWPVRDAVIPAGTIVDDDQSSNWSSIVLGLVPPPDSIPLDQATRNWLVQAYQLPDHRHEIAQVPNKQE